MWVNDTQSRSAAERKSHQSAGEPSILPPNFLSNPVKSHRKKQTTLATVWGFFLWGMHLSGDVLSVLYFNLHNILKTAPRSLGETFKTPRSASLMGACSSHFRIDKPIPNKLRPPPNGGDLLIPLKMVVSCKAIQGKGTKANLERLGGLF